MPDPREYKCQACGKRESRRVYKEPMPHHYVFICEECNENADQYLLDSLQPIIVYPEEIAVKIKNRQAQRRHRFIRINDINLPDCQLCGSQRNVVSVQKNEYKNELVVYRICRKCLAKKPYREMDLTPYNLEDLT